MSKSVDRCVPHPGSLREATELHHSDVPAAARPSDQSALPKGHELDGLRALRCGDDMAPLPRRIRRPFLPELQYVDAPDEIRFENPDIGAYVIIRKPAPGTANDEIVVTHLMRGALYPGSGARILAQVILDHSDEFGQATRLVFWDVQHSETKAAYDFDIDAATTWLAHVGRRVADAIGKRALRVGFELRPGFDEDREYLCLTLDLADARRGPDGARLPPFL
jgi:hypothetical protein